MNPLPYTRREFLRTAGKGLGLVAFSAVVPKFLTNSVLAGAPTPEKDRPVLVLIQLAGGNDGLNTLIQHENDDYYRLRPTIGIRKSDSLHRVTDTLAMHPSLGKLSELRKNGALSLVTNVGYPNPNRSHFRSMEIWETATDAHVNGYAGWIGRYFDAACDGQGRDPLGIHTTGVMPQSFFSEQPHNTFGLTGDLRSNKRPGGKPGAPNAADILAALNGVEPESADTNADYLRHSLMDALVTESRVSELLAKDKPEAQYPNTGLGRSLRQIAAMIAANLETRVYYATQGGYDTHVNQLGSHARLLSELSDAMAAFQLDMQRRKLDGRVLTMTFSEFGRRPAENGSSGTDHGTSAPLFIMGANIRDDLVGEAPDLGIDKSQDITHATDFRQVYSTVLQKHLGVAPEKVLPGKSFDSLDFI